MSKLKELQIKTLGIGKHSDGNGLYLEIKRSSRNPSGLRHSWSFRYSKGSGKSQKVHWMGLGPYPEISLKEARILTYKAQQARALNKDPLQEKRTIKGVSLQSTPFSEVARQYIENRKGGWKDGSRTEFNHYSQTKHYLLPHLGKMPVSQITREDILKVLQPIWDDKKPGVAEKVHRMLKKMLEFATSRGMREGSNPAEWVGNLEFDLPRPSLIKKQTHYFTLPTEDMPSVYRELTKRSGVSALCARFILLTGVRSKEGRGALWSEIDWDNKTWTVPGERMKNKKGFEEDHVVPLTNHALKILKEVAHLKDDTNLIFYHQKGKWLSGTTINKALKSAAYDKRAVIHGLRGAIVTWAGDHRMFEREVAQQTLAHVIGSKVDRAYDHSQRLEKRRKLLQAWGDFVCSKS